MEEHELRLLLPPGSKTYDERGGTATIDLVFGAQWVRTSQVTGPTCGCGAGNQTVRHVLLACPNFNDLRRETWESSGEERPRPKHAKDSEESSKICDPMT